MRTAVLLFGIAACASAQDAVQHGATLFAQTCASGYCHGARGAGGNAPRLAARGFTADYIAQTVRRGVPGTAMPAFASTLGRNELAMVIAYVASLNGVAPPRTRQAEDEPEKKLPPDAERGRGLFFDAVRGFGRCATCHEVGGMGIPVASPIVIIPASPVELKTLTTPHVRTAALAGESFPALVISQGSKQVKLYDLTAPPPVLRTFPPGAVAVQESSMWRHATALTGYSDPELQAILIFLRAVIHP